MPRRDARDSLALGSVRSYEHEYPDEQRPPGRQVFPMISLDKHSDTAALIGRLFFSSMFLLFGYGKLTGYAGTVSYMGSLGLPAPALFTVLATSIEIGGGLLVLVGYKTRLVSLGSRSTC